MQNPWRNFPENSPFVLKIDEHFVEQYNASAKPEHKLQTSVMPTPYNGGLDAAKVVFLSLNPGYDILDNFRTEEYRKAIRENLADPYGYDIFVQKNIVKQLEKIWLIHMDMIISFIWIKIFQV